MEWPCPNIATDTALLKGQILLLIQMLLLIGDWDQRAPSPNEWRLLHILALNKLKVIGQTDCNDVRYSSLVVLFFVSLPVGCCGHDFSSLTKRNNNSIQFHLGSLLSNLYF